MASERPASRAWPGLKLRDAPFALRALLSMRIYPRPEEAQRPISKGESKASSLSCIAPGIVTPSKVLAAIEGDHLSGHRRRVEQEVHSAADLLD
jgi:hypothetical protein